MQTKPSKAKPRGLRRRLLGRILHGVRRYLALGIVATIGATALSYLTPLIVSFTVDSVIGDKAPALPAPLGRLFEQLGGRGWFSQNLWARKTYQGKTVVDLPEIRMENGSRIALVGSSGSGKTTWLKLLMGLVMPDAPDTKDVRKRDDSGIPRISPAFQEDCLFLTETAESNVRMVSDEKEAERIRECLDSLLPAGTAGQTAAELSGGMMRRTAVARAVLAGGDLLLLDEPFRGLDAENKKKLAAFVLKNQAGRILIMTAHDESEAALLNPEKIVRLPDLTL